MCLFSRNLRKMTISLQAIVVYLPVNGYEDNGEGGEEYAGGLGSADQLAQKGLQN